MLLHFAGGAPEAQEERQNRRDHACYGQWQEQACRQQTHGFHRSKGKDDCARECDPSSPARSPLAVRKEQESQREEEKTKPIENHRQDFCRGKIDTAGDGPAKEGQRQYGGNRIARALPEQHGRNGD